MHIGDVPLVGRLQLVEFLPRQRHGDAETGPRAHRPGGNGGGAAPIAQVVDKDLADPVGRSAFHHEAFRDQLGHVRDDGLRKRLDGIPVVFGPDRHHHVQALAAAGFQERRQAQLRQERAQQHGRLPDRGPAHALAGIEVEHHAIGQFIVAGQRILRMELDHVPLRGRQQALRAGHFQHRRMVGVEPGIELLDARHLRHLGMFLEKQLATDAGRRAHQRHGPAAQMRQHQLANQRVVAHHVDLGGAAVLVDHAVGIGDFQAGRQNAVRCR